MADSAWADGLADRIAELLNDHPDTYLSTVQQEVTTYAVGPVLTGEVVRAGLTAENGDVHTFVVTVTEVPRG